MKPDPTDKDLEAWIERVNAAFDDDGAILTEWEAQFMRDVTEEWTRRRRLSDASVLVLRRLCERVR